MLNAWNQFLRAFVKIHELLEICKIICKTHKIHEMCLDLYWCRQGCCNKYFWKKCHFSNIFHNFCILSGSIRPSILYEAKGNSFLMKRIYLSRYKFDFCYEFITVVLDMGLVTFLTHSRGWHVKESFVRVDVRWKIGGLLCHLIVGMFNFMFFMEDWTRIIF